MKRIIYAIVLLTLCLSISACGRTEEDKKATNSSNSQTQNSGESASSSTESDEAESIVLYGYKYSFPASIFQKGSTKGSVIECNDCKVFAYGQNVIEFTSWETVVDDCQNEFFSAIGSPFQFYPSSQKVKTTKLITNKNGEELYRVEGTFIKTTDGDSDKEFVAYYHLTDENKVRFFVGLNDDNDVSLIAETVDYVADHLVKEEE